MRKKMKSQLNKILIVTLVILFFSLSKSYSIEDVTEFTDAINEAREEFNDAPEASTEQSKIIDEALKEIDKATEYAQEAINANNAEDAIKTLEFIEKTLTDVGSIIPQEFSSDMSKMDISAIPKEEMDIITEVTAQMKTAKEKKQKDFMSDLVEINLKGIDTATISENLNSLGIDTIKLDLNLDEENKMKTWTKQEWANSYKGSILTSDGLEVITDKEISSKAIELEGKFQKNTLKIESKRNQLSILNNQLNPISSELESLNEKKSLLTSQYNLEISKLSAENFSNLETQKSIELSEKLKNELENVTSEALKAEQQSALLKTEISSLNKSLNEQILQSNKIREDINNLNSNKLELTETIALKAAKLNELKGQSPNLSSNSNITELTAKLEDSEKLKSELSNLQSQIENKNLIVSQKISQINSLNTKLNPLADQVNLLKEKKENLQKQYNSELTNISNSFNLDDLSKSKGLAENLDKNINSVTDEIKKIEASSSEIQSDISKLNFEINTEKDTLNKISFEIVNSQKELNRTSGVISSKELELDRLLNTDLAQTNQKLNQQLNQVSLQKDFIQSQFEKSIDLEVEALQRYHSALGDTAEEIDFAMREVGVILDADPKKARAFDIEKYATYAGLSNDFIQKSINAVNNDDWDAQKNILKDITKALAKNPKWVVDVPSNAELNVMIAEEKAIQEAAMIAIEGQKIKEQVDKIINEKTSSLKQLSSLNLGTLKYAATWEGMPEHEFLTKEYDELINEANLTSKLLEYENKSKSFKPAYENWVKNMTEANRQEWVNIQNDMNKLQRETSQIQWDAQKKMRENVIKAVEDAKVSINEITQNEIAKNAGYNYADDINKILDKIPSFDSAKRQRANEVLSGIGHTDIWFGGVPIEVGDQGAALRAALGERSDYEAYTAALKAMAEMGEKPVSEYMTGPYWEMTNVKAAAIVRSKKYDYVDDYEYMNAYYRDPLQLNTTQRQEVEGELKNILGNNNPKFNALSKQANSLKSEIETNNVKLSNINSNISELENEISSIKSSEQNLKNQISKLNNDLTSKQSLINGKNKSLTDLQKNLDPINNKISELEAKKNDLNNNIQNQINLVTQNTKKSEEITQKTLELENKLSKEMSEIDQQINGYKKETEKLTVNISSLNNEILNLENEKPDLSNKISKINEELTGYSNVKAELSVLTAEQKAEVKNIDIDINKLESELSNLKTSESQINQQLASLSNELKSKEDIIKNNNLSISEIQKQIDPLNSQIETLENQKVSLNEQFNKDFAELSNQIEQTTETKSAEIDKLKVDFETQISKFNEEINNFESQANELNSTVSALNEEIKSIEVETPQISNQIAKLNQDIKNFTDIKADLAMATAKNIGLKVDEKVIQSIERLDGTAIIVFNDGLVRVIDEKMLIDQAEKFIYPLSEFSINSKIYTADAVRPELLYVEEITNAYTKAKAARVVARENLAAVESAPGASKAEIQAAEATVKEAKYAEIAAGQSLVSNSKMASATAQQATLENLRAIASTPGMGKWDVRRANAAVKAAEAQIAGLSYNYEGAVNKIANNEKKWNAWRVDLYKKDIEAAKASGKTREMALLQRDMERFKQRRIDEVVYREAIQTKQSNYLGVLNNVATKSAVLSGASLTEAGASAQQATASASLSVEAQEQVRAETSALQSAGVSAKQSAEIATAKTARLSARENWNAALASGDKAAADAAQAVWESARDAEAVVDMAAADAIAKASVASVAAVAQDATRAAQEATLAALQEIESMPGGSSWDAFAAQAAIEQVKAEMEGRDYSGKWGSSYEESIAEIERMKSTGKSASECISAEGC